MKMFHGPGLIHIQCDIVVHYQFGTSLSTAEGKVQVQWPVSRSCAYFNRKAWMLIYAPETGGYFVSRHPHNRGGARPIRRGNLLSS